MARATTTLPPDVSQGPTAAREAGPLTTVFTTPDFCAPSMWHDPATPALSSSICMPPDFYKLYGYRYGFYSPGICPLGYTEGCAFPTPLAVESNGTPFLGGTLLPGETARICCPAGFTCYTKGPSIDADKTYSQCISTGSLSTFEAYDYGSHSYIMSTAAAKAFAIQVRWQLSDLSKLETDPTVSGSRYPTSTPKAAPSVTPSRVGVATTGPAATEGTLGDGDSPRDGLSKGSIIALSTALPLASLVLGILAYFVWKRQHHRAQQSEKSTTDECEGTGGFLRDGPQSTASVSPLTPGTTGFETNSMAELDRGTVSEMDAEKPTYEADPDAHPWMELETRERIQELPHTFVAELEGNQPRSLAAAHEKP
ncbi:hypothetical protein PG984_002819 [Apiospora sp. TS-2023a]